MTDKASDDIAGNTFEIIVPGTWLAGDDREWSHHIQGQLDAVRDQYRLAGAALRLFYTSRQAANSTSAEGLRVHWHAQRDRSAALYAEIQSERNAIGETTDLSAVHIEVARRLAREDRLAGIVTPEDSTRVTFIAAQAFVFALDLLQRMLRHLRQEAGVPSSIRDHVTAFEAAFPDLTGVRNSAHHIDERRLGLDRNGRPLALRALGSNAPSGLMVLNSLFGTRYVMAMNSGAHGFVDISDASMTQVQSIVQAVFDAFVWHGPKTLVTA